MGLLLLTVAGLSGAGLSGAGLTATGSSFGVVAAICGVVIGLLVVTEGLVGLLEVWVVMGF